MSWSDGIREPLKADPIWAEALDRIDRLEAINADLLEALQECADDLEGMIEHEYGNTKDAYPSQRRRYERDISPVLKARAAIAKATGKEAPPNIVHAGKYGGTHSGPFELCTLCQSEDEHR